MLRRCSVARAPSPTFPICRTSRPPAPTPIRSRDEAVPRVHNARSLTPDDLLCCTTVFLREEGGIRDAMSQSPQGQPFSICCLHLPSTYWWKACSRLTVSAFNVMPEARWGNVPQKLMGSPCCMTGQCHGCCVTCVCWSKSVLGVCGGQSLSEGA